MSLAQALIALRQQHLSTNRRRDTTAIDIESAVWLCQACTAERDRRLPQQTRVLELGSGFSTWALRLWQQGVGKDVDIWTVDDERLWLAVTKAEITALGYRQDHFYFLHQVIEADPSELFDVVFVDMDSTATRVSMAKDIVHWTRPGGLIILDDWQMNHYRGPMTFALAGLGIVPITPEPSTKDRHGRYLAWARK